ncbi:MAG: gamma-glutamyltransferase [Actinomycetota bacterium]
MDLAASGRRWAIATPHTAATEAGAAAFERGGNAIDAALAAAVMLGVVYPHNCGVGGDVFALVQRADIDGGQILAVNSSGRAPLAADPAALRARHGNTMPLRGPAPITVPGAVSGWETLHGLGARLAWEDHFTAAVWAAHDGYTLPDALAVWHATPESRAAFGADPGLAALFYPGGAALRSGATVRQPALGRTLEALAAAGADALYRGAVGAAYVEGLRAAGSPITTEDLAAHAASVLPPLIGAWRDLHVRVAPPNSQGYSLLQILAAAERLQLDPDPCGPDAGRWARIFLAAERDVRRHLGDPGRMDVHPPTLLSDGHLAAFCDEVRAALTPGPGSPKPGGDTIALVTADDEGHAVSLIQSLFHGYGAGILEPSTGIIANDRGACFTLEPGRPGTFAPGALPPHTLLPAMVHSGIGLAGVAGTMGGYQQPQIDAQTIAGVFALDRSPADAVAAPRFVVDDLPEGDALPGVVAEAGVPEDAVTAIADAGLSVQRTHDLDDWVGHAQMIRVTRDGFVAGSDPRAHGGALAG